MAATGLLGMNPYRKGLAVDISSKPTSLYIDMQNKERARQDALDRYFMDYDKNINPAGMRNVDIEDLTKLSQEAKAFYFQNKKAIQNPMLDGGKAYSKFTNYNKEQLALVSQSKQEAANGKAYQAALQAAKKSGMTIDEETTNDFIQSQYKVKDPRYKSYDMSRFNAYKPFSAVDEMENVFGKDLKNFTKKSVTQKPEGKSFVNTEVTVFDAENHLPKIELYAQNRLATGIRTRDGFSRYVAEISENKNEYNKVNKVFKNYYGRDAQNLNDIATGVILSLAPYKSEQKVGTFTPQARIEIASAIKQLGGGGKSDFEVDPYINNVYIQSENAEPTSANLLSSIGYNAQGLKNIKTRLPQAYLKLKFDYQRDYILQDSNKTIYAFDKNDKKDDVIVIPYETYKIDLTDAMLGQKPVGDVLTKPPQQQPQPKPTPAPKGETMADRMKKAANKGK